MKKVFVVLLMLACFALVPEARAAYLSAEDVSPSSLLEIVRQKYDAKLDKDGDICINSKGRVFVFVKGKSKLVRILCMFKAYEKRSAKEMRALANKFNNDKVLLRVAIDPKDGSSSCDHYIVYNGGINDTNLLEAIDWVIQMRDTWEQFVVNGGFDE